jgi:hypothetical protein
VFGGEGQLQLEPARSAKTASRGIGAEQDGYAWLPMSSQAETPAPEKTIQRIDKVSPVSSGSASEGKEIDDGKLPRLLGGPKQSMLQVTEVIRVS